MRGREPEGRASSARHGGSWTPPLLPQIVAAILLCCARRARRKVRDIVRIDPGFVRPAMLVVAGEAGVGERDHAVEGARAAGVEEGLDADVLMVAGIIHLVELVASAELGA